MSRTQADRFCKRVNDMKTAFVADVDDMPASWMPGFPCAVRVKHVGGNEVGYARHSDEAEYMVGQIERQFSDGNLVACR